MRKIGEISKQTEAQLFLDFLRTEGIQNRQTLRRQVRGFYRDEHLEQPAGSSRHFGPTVETLVIAVRRRQRAKNKRRRAQQRQKTLKFQSAAVAESIRVRGYFRAHPHVTVAAWTSLGSSAPDRIRLLQMSGTLDFCQKCTGGMAPTHTHSPLRVLHLAFNPMAFTFLGQMMSARWPRTLSSLLLSGLVSNFSLSRNGCQLWRPIGCGLRVVWLRMDEESF